MFQLSCVCNNKIRCRIHLVINFLTNVILVGVICVYIMQLLKVTEWVNLWNNEFFFSLEVEWFDGDILRSLMLVWWWGSVGESIPASLKRQGNRFCQPLPVWELVLLLLESIPIYIDYSLSNNNNNNNILISINKTK